MFGFFKQEKHEQIDPNIDLLLDLGLISLVSLSENDRYEVINLLSLIGKRGSAERMIGDYKITIDRGDVKVIKIKPLTNTI